MIFQIFISQNHIAVINWNFKDFPISLIKNKWGNDQVMRWFPENVFWYYSSWHQIFGNPGKWILKEFMQSLGFFLRELVLGLIILKYFKFTSLSEMFVFLVGKSVNLQNQLLKKVFFTFQKIPVEIPVTSTFLASTNWSSKKNTWFPKI